jgi:hypothetical protein
MSDEKLQNTTSEALRQLGRDDLADQLELRTEPQLDPVPVLVDDGAPDAQAEGEAFLAELKAARNRGKVSLPGLLDQ